MNLLGVAKVLCGAELPNQHGPASDDLCQTDHRNQFTRVNVPNLLVGKYSQQDQEASQYGKKAYKEDDSHLNVFFENQFQLKLIKNVLARNLHCLACLNVITVDCFRIGVVCLIASCLLVIFLF